MERILKLIIMWIFLKDCVHTCYAFNGQYMHQQYIPNDQPYPLGNVFIPNIIHQQQQQQQQHHQVPNGFQSQQQMSTHYQYQPILPNQRVKTSSILVPLTVKDLSAYPFFNIAGQHQMQTQYSGPQQYLNYQEQYQTNRVLKDGREYDTSQYQYQDGTQQTQEQNMLNDYYHAPQLPRESWKIDTLESQGQEPIIEQMQHTQNYDSHLQESIVQPIKGTIDEIQFNRPPDNTVLQLDSNQRQRQGGKLQQQQDHQNYETHQPVKGTLDEIQFNGPPDNSVLELNSNQRQRQGGQLQLQQDHQNHSQNYESHQPVKGINDEIQFNRPPNSTVLQLDSNQRQHQGGQLQLQQDHQNHTQNYESQLQESIEQPVKGTLEEMQFNGPPDNSVLELDSNQRQHQGEELQLQEAHQNSQPKTEAEKSKIDKVQEQITETIPTLKFIAPNTRFDINIQTDKSQCPPGFQGLLTKPGNCSNFLRCSDRQIYQNDCVTSTDAIGMPETLKNFCANKAYGIYVHPYDCSKIVDCSPNGLFEKDRATGTVFNEKILGGDHKHEVQCNLHKTTDSRHSSGLFCPNGVFGQFPYPFSNEQFINCENSETFVESCPPGTTFIISKSYCDAPNYKHATTWHALGNSLNVETHRVVSCPESVNGSYLYPFDAKKYIICQGSRMQTMSCTSGDVYSVPKGICMVRAQVDLFDRVRSIEDMQPLDSEIIRSLYKQYNKIACPMEALGVFPYPFANTKYIKCLDARLLIKRCRPGFLFSLSRKLCDIPDHGESFDTAVPVGSMESNHDDVDIEASGDKTFLECPSGVSDNFVYPFLNTRYTKCLKGVTEIETCLNGAIYSIRQKKCLSRQQVDRNDYVEGIETALKRFSNDHTLGVSCGPENHGFYAHPEDWRKFVICRNGIVTVKTCDESKIFDITQHKCV